MKSTFNMRFTPVIILTLFIAWVIYQADTEQHNLLMSLGKIKYLDKVAHFTLFGLLALSINNALHFQSIQIFFRKIYLGSIMVLIVALIEEFSQLGFESRTFDWIDMLFDLLGISFFSSNLFIRNISRFLR